MDIHVIHSDITLLGVEAIVNPANSQATMGGGVAGVIKRRGGKIIEEEAMAQAPIPVGKAVLTQAGSLPARHVIHSPTMKQPASRTNPEAVRLATLAALECAEAHGLASVAFPGMGTGTGKVPRPDAALAMVKVLASFAPRSVREVYLVGRDEEMVNAFQEAVASHQSAR